MAEYAYEQPANGQDVDVAGEQQQQQQHYQQQREQQQQYDQEQYELQQHQQQQAAQQQQQQQQYEGGGAQGQDASIPQNGHASPSAQQVPIHHDGATNGSASNTINVIRKTLSSWVGFSNLPNQVHRRSVR